MLHHAIREHSMEAGKVVKAEGKPNDLLERIRRDPLFKDVRALCVTMGGDDLRRTTEIHPIQPTQTNPPRPPPSLPFSYQIHDELDALVDPMLFVGRAPEQVDEFIAEEVDPVLKRHAALLAIENKDGVSV